MLSWSARPSQPLKSPITATAEALGAHTEKWTPPPRAGRQVGTQLVGQVPVRALVEQVHVVVGQQAGGGRGVPARARLTSPSPEADRWRSHGAVRPCSPGAVRSGSRRGRFPPGPVHVGQQADDVGVSAGPGPGSGPTGAASWAPRGRYPDGSEVGARARGPRGRPARAAPPRQPCEPRQARRRSIVSSTGPPHSSGAEAGRCKADSRASLLRLPPGPLGPGRHRVKGARSFTIVDVGALPVGGEARQVVGSPRGQGALRGRRRGIARRGLELEDPGPEHAVVAHGRSHPVGHGAEVLPDDRRSRAARLPAQRRHASPRSGTARRRRRRRRTRPGASRGGPSP